MNPKKQILEKTRKDVGWDALLAHVASLCSTLQGSECAINLLPFDSLAEAKNRQLEIAESRNLSILDASLPFGGILDLRSTLEKMVNAGFLLTKELLECAHVLRSYRVLQKHILDRADLCPFLLIYANQMHDLSLLSNQIDQAIDETGEIKETASPAYRQLCKQLQTMQATMATKAEKWMSNGSLAHVWQDRYVTQRDGRYVLPVRSELRAAIRGIVTDASASRSTIFVEPEEWIEDNNRLRLLSIEKQAEERRILQALSAELYAAMEHIQHNAALVSRLDVIQAQARFGLLLQSRPIGWAEQDSIIDLRGARHPLLCVQRIKVIPNDVLIKQGHILVVSGPNAGGKTAILKLTGLLVCMAQAGFDLPVLEGSTLPWFTNIFTDVGDDQSLEKNVSTFSAHLANLKQCLEMADDKTLLLIDEIATGTDPKQGAALAQALLEAFAQKKTTVLVTTHYPELKNHALQGGHFVTASVGFDMETLRPTYRLHMGTPGPSETLPVAQQWGLPPAIIQRAKELVSDDQNRLEQVLQDLLLQQEQLATMRMETSQLQDHLTLQWEEIEKQKEALSEQKRLLRQSAFDQTVVALQESQRELKALRLHLRKRAQSDSFSSEELSTLQQQLNVTRNELHATYHAQAIPVSDQSQTHSNWDIGMEAYIPKMNVWVTILSKPDQGKVEVQAGRTRIRLPIHEIRPKATAKEPPFRNKPSFAHKQAAVTNSQPIEPVITPLRTDAQTLDLRGARAEEAVAKADAFVNKALQQNWDAVFFIHGHGTGALKKALRAFFLSHPAVKQLRSAEAQDGGEGVTILFL